MSQLLADLSSVETNIDTFLSGVPTKKKQQLAYGSTEKM